MTRSVREYGPAVGIGSVAVAHAIAPARHAVDHRGDEPLIADLLGTVFPLLLALAVLYSAVWIRRSDLEPVHEWRVFGWCLAGVAGIAIVTAAMIGHLQLEGESVSGVGHVTATTSVGGAVLGVLVGIYDASRTRQLELTAANERKFQAVFDGTLDALLVVNDDTECLDANPAACELLGTSRTDFVGRSMTEFVADDVAVDAAWERFLETGKLRGEFPLVRADGERRIVELAATANVQPGRHLAALRDVTDRKASEEALLEERETVEFLNQILRHEILNAMNVVLGELERLETADDRSARADSLETIRARSERIVTIVQNVRSVVSTITDDQPEAVDLSRTLTDVLADVRTNHPDATVTVRDGEVPDGVVVTADGLLGSVFENVLQNAIEHNDGDPTVEVAVAVEGETVAVRIADDGPGIPDDRQREIFGRGERGIKSPGSGFGLYIVDTLVSHYGGDVRVETSDLGGAAFVIRLPRASADDRDDS